MSTPRVFQDARLQMHQLKMPRAQAHHAKIGLTVGDKVVQPAPINIPGHPTWSESARVSVDGRGFTMNLKHPGAIGFAIQSMPIKYLSAGQYIGGTVPTAEVPPYDPINMYKMLVMKSAETDL